MEAFFDNHSIESERFTRGPIENRIPGFEVLVVQAIPAGEAWHYISCGASEVRGDEGRHEYMIIAPYRDATHLETLAMVSNFHAHDRYRGVHLGRILEIGRPWVPGSRCDHLLVSLPHLHGPKLEVVPGQPPITILWLLPITKQEADFARAHDIEALEQRFEKRAIDTVDPRRRSVV